MYIVKPKNELTHYGVKGMKWGVRHDPVSMGGRARRALAGVYGLNERTYRKLGNNTLASMNAAARKQQLQKAAAADTKKKARIDKKIGEKNAKKIAKVEKYRTRLVKKSRNKADYYKQDAAENRNALDDLNKNRRNSQVYKEARDAYLQRQHSDREWRDEPYSFWDTAADYANFEANGRKTMSELRQELQSNVDTSSKQAKRWANTSKTLSTTPISATTTKKDIKKVYKGK